MVKHSTPYDNERLTTTNIPKQPYTMYAQRNHYGVYSCPMHPMDCIKTTFNPHARLKDNFVATVAIAAIFTLPSVLLILHINLKRDAVAV